MDGLRLCTGDFVVIMDADLSHHPKYLAEFITTQQMTNCDIVTGSRYIESGGVVNWGFKRKLTSRGANFLASSFLGVKCSDLTGSFRLYKKEVLERVIKDVVSRGYAFQMEIIIRALQYGYSLQEVRVRRDVGADRVRRATLREQQIGRIGVPDLPEGALEIIVDILKYREIKISYMSFFRSETMAYYQLVVPRESAWEVFNELGKTNMVIFRTTPPRFKSST